MSSINSFFIRVLPMYKLGLGWIVPAIIGGLIGFSIVQVKILLNYRSSRLNK
ncbi:branched-chain amino acid transport system II carrier protein [Priestia megaterium]|uniref:branched-chain amino acid transport system II carrier protein n=1 Tax=Priestia megaterium TaxID=1404 RepID=UPI002413610E|nr:branched-chain amino acid transport system II carrier protein [Priestia megaterium]